MSNVDVFGPNGCWLWTGKLNQGYGSWHAFERAHVWIYRITYGSIPVGLDVSHTCHVKACVNPDHLVTESHQQNMARTFTNFCPRGHEFTTENTRRTAWGRACKRCNRLAQIHGGAALIPEEEWGPTEHRRRAFCHNSPLLGIQP